MSKIAVFTSLFALIVMTGVCPSWSIAQSPWQQSTLNQNKASVEVGAKVFDRPGDDSIAPVVFDSVSNATLFNQEQATDLGSTFGLEVKFKIPRNEDRSLEIRTIIAEWDETTLVTGNNLASSFFPAPLDPTIAFTAPQSFNYQIESDYFSFEIMSKRAVQPGLILSAGPRFISTTDAIAINSTTAITDAIAGPVTATQLNNFDAKNSLVGLQVGIEINRPIAEAVNITLFGRAGGYYNATNFRTSTSSSDTLGNNTPVALTRIDRSTESFVAELGGRVNFDIIPNCLETYIGYEATAIDGIALSAANVGNTGPIDTRNTLFFQAITFGTNLSF